MLEISIFSTSSNSVKRLQTAENILELENIPFFLCFLRMQITKRKKKSTRTHTHTHTHNLNVKKQVAVSSKGSVSMYKNPQHHIPDGWLRRLCHIKILLVERHVSKVACHFEHKSEKFWKECRAKQIKWQTNANNYIIMSSTVSTCLLTSKGDCLATIRKKTGNVRIT